MSKKAFTLIELLAVIVILAIIALIAVPIIINIIRDTKEKSRDISKDLYLTAVEQTILKENIEGSLNPSTCKVNIDGNIVCDDKEIKIEVNGEKPCTGDIKLNKGMVVDSRLGYCKNNKEYKDNSGANTPELSGLTPVLYKDDSWVIADISEEWYDYEKYEWANAVILTDSGKKKQEGDKLNLEKDVKAMFVWIPRYEYKIDGQYGKGGTSPTDPGEIEVNFISVKGTSATEGYTIHPAFTFGEDELSGIWVGKFETSADKTSACYTSEGINNCNNADQDPYILPNVSSLRYQYIVNQFVTAKKFDKNIIGADSHMMKNREWGAVAYLSQSKYGKYGNPDYVGANKEVYQNKSSSFITGSSNGTPSQDDAITTQYTYDVELNGTGASTTGTIYGVYDMSGGANDRVMGNYSGIAFNSGFDASWFTTPDNVKYCDIYIIDNTDSCKDEECKGYALGETANWYGDNAAFVNSSYPWFYRGGEYNVDANAGVFYFGGYYGNSHGNGSFHVVIAPSESTN